MTAYRTGAPLYLDAGWAGVLPLPPRKKSPPPTGCTGWNGKDPSAKMIETWRNETVGDFQAASNIAIHMPDDVIGIDVDHYDGKTGAQTLTTLCQELGPLPDSYISTSRADGYSGILWYRVEPGLRWPSGPGKDIEFVHKGHRYAVVWPSIHDKTGQQYKWYDHAGEESEPPEPDNLAWLPDEWQARFTGGEQRRQQDVPQRNATPEELATCLTDGPICYAATKALAKFDDRLTVQARHDSARDTVMALMRLGEQGHKGINSAIAELKNRFVNMVTADRSDGSEDDEYERMIDGAAVKVCANRTPLINRGCCGTQTKAEAPQDATGADSLVGRWMSLDDYLDGTYVAPEPIIGGTRDDMIQFLYPGRWHTCIGLTTAAKTWWALWHVKAVLQDGGHVIYIHFEEPRPEGTISRLLALGVDKEVIRKRFHWPDSRPWTAGEMAREVALLEDTPMLAVLDGINTACGAHGWDVENNKAVGEYRSMFVTPLTDLGTTVLSLGHPVKSTKRQSESYSYGAAGWLNDVDGVGYRMASSATPVGRGKKGSSSLHSVKDRYGEVERWGEQQEGEGTPWYYMGQFVVDSSPKADLMAAATICHVSVPAKNEEGGGKDRTDYLADEVVAYLKEGTGKFQTFNWLDTALRAKDLKFSKSDLPVALQKLVNRGLLEWPEVEGNKKRPGWLIVEDQS